MESQKVRSTGESQSSNGIRHFSTKYSKSILSLQAWEARVLACFTCRAELIESCSFPCLNCPCVTAWAEAASRVLQGSKQRYSKESMAVSLYVSKCSLHSSRNFCLRPDLSRRLATFCENGPVVRVINPVLA